ncbi:CG8501, partial [Drosophila busckii]
MKSGSMLIQRLLLLLSCCALLASAEVLECYNCAVNPGANGTLPICSHLNNTARYLKQCPNSTMCIKTISFINLPTGERRATLLRGCAPQIAEHHVLPHPRAQWQKVKKIEEPYSVGCIAAYSDSRMRTVDTIHCFCRGNLCNAAS